MSIIDDIERERRSFLERFGRSPKVVTVPRSRLAEFAPIVKEAMWRGVLKGPPEPPTFFAGMEVRYNGANQVVACALK